MSHSWRQCNWGDLAILEYGKGLRRETYDQGEYRVYGTNGPTGWHSEPLCTNPTVIIGRKGAYRGVHYSHDPCYVIDTAFYLVPKIDLDMRWAYYCLRNQDINGMDSGSAIPSTSRGDFYHLPVLLPPFPEQRAIAHILGTLDDKIELNRRMNETLEAMARALFKSWFVDFDPVRAKAEGRETGLPKHIADLFPERFVESELGEIPEGWKLDRLGEHFEAVKGVSYKGDGLADAGMPLHNLNSIFEGGGYKYEGIKYYTGEFAERHITKPGDLIVANTEQGHYRLLIGYAAIVPRLFGDKGIATHHIYRLRPKLESPLTSVFACFLLNSPRMHDVVSGYANGTTVNMLPVDGVQTPKIIVPPAPLVAAFDRAAAQIESRREEMIAESRTLAALRDTLLPKLLSGELRVRNEHNEIGEGH